MADKIKYKNEDVLIIDNEVWEKEKIEQTIANIEKDLTLWKDRLKLL